MQAPDTISRKHNQRVCSVVDCGRKHEARGWCHLHYLRWYRRGGKPGKPRYFYGTPIERFWHYTKKTNDCWFYTNGIDKYPRIAVGGGKVTQAHRFSYRTFVGPIPPDHEVHHRCQNKLCVNPVHLVAVTEDQHRELHRAA